MAFSFQEKTNRDWFKFITVTIVVVFLGFGSYLLFFTEAPLIEVVAPPQLKQVSELSQVNFNTSDFENSEVFNSLQRHVADAVPGKAGRENPFSRF